MTLQACTSTELPGRVADTVSNFVMPMVIILIVFIAILAICFWLLWRRGARPADREFVERCPELKESAAEKVTAIPEIETGSADFPEDSFPAAVEEQSSKDYEQPEVEEPTEMNGAGESLGVESSLPGAPADIGPVGRGDTGETRVSSPGDMGGAAEEKSCDQIEPREDMGEVGIAVDAPEGEELAPVNSAESDSVSQPVGAAIPERSIVEVDEPSAEELTEEGIRLDEIQDREPVEETEKTPQRYRPPVQRPPHPRQAGGRPENHEERRPVPSEVSLSILVRLTFDRFGFCEIGLLPECTAELDNEIVVKLGRDSLFLLAQEDWYQDLQLGDTGERLRDGVELKGVLSDQRRARWLLTGRDLYVLARHPRASGFVSATRLALGRPHVVLCLQESLAQVEALLTGAGCEGYTKLSQEDGIPVGWVGLRDVLPTKAIPLDPGSDPFYPVKPAPDIEIDLEGGVCMGGSVWLEGYPPEIRVLGELDSTLRVLIDGNEAQRTTSGIFVADGYDMRGQHSVYCEGMSCSRSYAIEEPPGSWDTWPAFHFGEAEICGPLVHVPAGAGDRQAVTFPISNPVLVGAQPGEIFHCTHRSVSHWKGYVPFDVVWALPAQPLGCDKKSSKILQFANLPVVPREPLTKRARDWSTAILDASRKGLRIDSEDPDATALWREYKKVARSIWRASR